MKKIPALALLAVLGFAAGCGAANKIVVNTATSALAGRILNEINSTITVDSRTATTIANATAGTRLTCKNWDGQTITVPNHGASAAAELEHGTTVPVTLHVTRTPGGRVTASCKPPH